MSILIAQRVIISVPLDEPGSSFFFPSLVYSYSPLCSGMLGGVPDGRRDTPASSGRIQNELLSLGMPGKPEAAAGAALYS